MDKFTQVLTPFGEPQRPELLTHVEQLLAEHYSCSRDQAVCGAEGLGTERTWGCSKTHGPCSQHGYTVQEQEEAHRSDC